MITIRIFDTEDEANWALEELKKGGFYSEIHEDKFDGVPIQKFNVPARYRLKVKDGDFERITKFLVTRLKEKTDYNPT